MKLLDLKGKGIVGLASVLVAFASPYAMASSAADADGTPTLLTELQLTSSTLGATGWVFGSQDGGSLVDSQTPSPTSSAASIFAMNASYPAPGGGQVFAWADYSVAALNTEDLYIEFWAKMPLAKEGCKFFKIFGQGQPGSRADMTFGTDYTGADYGAMREVMFGDGSTLANDGENVIMLDGSGPSWIGRSYGIASVQTPQNAFFASANWGTSWHHFRIHVKFNSGTSSSNETNNGEIYFEIDGKPYVDATGLYDRNPANAPIDHIEFFGWAQKDPSPFQVWIDDVRVSTGGFMDTPLPSPPGDVSVK